MIHQVNCRVRVNSFWKKIKPGIFECENATLCCLKSIHMKHNLLKFVMIILVYLIIDSCRKSGLSPKSTTGNLDPFATGAYPKKTKLLNSL